MGELLFGGELVIQNVVELGEGIVRGLQPGFAAGVGAEGFGLLVEEGLNSLFLGGFELELVEDFEQALIVVGESITGDRGLLLGLFVLTLLSGLGKQVLDKCQGQSRGSQVLEDLGLDADFGVVGVALLLERGDLFSDVTATGKEVIFGSLEGSFGFVERILAGFKAVGFCLQIDFDLLDLAAEAWKAC